MDFQEAMISSFDIILHNSSSQRRPQLDFITAAVTAAELPSNTRDIHPPSYQPKPIAAPADL
jgi:hypothetical protein